MQGKTKDAEPLPCRFGTRLDDGSLCSDTLLAANDLENEALQLQSRCECSNGDALVSVICV